MAGSEDRSYCVNCGHECHCYSDNCDQYVGVGMSDKIDKCGCSNCKCKSYWSEN